MADLRENRAKHMLKRGETVIAVACTDTDTVDTLGSTGAVDLIWIEMEHGSATWSQLSDISRACDLWGMTSLVRVNNNDPWLVGRALDRGIQAVVLASLLGTFSWLWLVVESSTGRHTLIVDFERTTNPWYRVWQVLLPDHQVMSVTDHVLTAAWAAVVILGCWWVWKLPSPTSDHQSATKIEASDSRN